MKTILLILSILLTFNVKGQAIIYVQFPYQADINVNFVDYKYQADIVVMKVNNKLESNKPGLWYWEYGTFNRGYYTNNQIKVHVVRYKYQADYNVFLTTNRWEIKVTEEYLNDIK